jgi:hypothetical protein
MEPGYDLAWGGGETESKMSDVKSPSSVKPSPTEAPVSKRDKAIPLPPEPQPREGLQSHEAPPPQAADSSPRPVADTPIHDAAPTRPRMDRPNADEVEKPRPATTATASDRGEIPLLETAMLLATRNVEAVLTSSQVVMRAAEELTQTLTELHQRNIQQFSSLARNLTEARSLNEFVALQQDHTRTTFEEIFEETTRLGHDLTRKFGEMIDSVLSNQMELTTEVRRKAT